MKHVLFCYQLELSFVDKILEIKVKSESSQISCLLHIHSYQQAAQTTFCWDNGYILYLHGSWVSLFNFEL